MLHRALTACLLITCAPLTACGGDDDDKATGGTGGASWLGLSSNLDCGNLDSQVPAKLVVNYQGQAHTFNAHVFIAGEDTVAIRLVCQNKANPGETLAATLSAETRNDLMPGVYDLTMPSLDEDEAAEGGLELEVVDGMLTATRAGSAGYEQRNDAWSARYDTDSGLPAGEETRAAFDWNEDVAFEVTSAEELPEDDQVKGGGATSIRTHEVHGSIEIHGLIAANGTLDATDTDGRETIDMRADF